MHSVMHPRSLLFHGGSRVCRAQFPAMIANAERCAATLRTQGERRLPAAYERDAAFMRAFLAEA